MLCCLAHISALALSFPEQKFFRKQAGFTKTIRCSSHACYLYMSSVLTVFLIIWSSCFFVFTPVETSQEDSSDDNRSNSLGRSAPSDDVSVASDYQEEGSQECEYRVHMYVKECKI